MIALVGAVAVLGVALAIHLVAGTRAEPSRDEVIAEFALARETHTLAVREAHKLLDEAGELRSALPDGSPVAIGLEASAETLRSGLLALGVSAGRGDPTNLPAMIAWSADARTKTDAISTANTVMTDALATAYEDLASEAEARVGRFPPADQDRVRELIAELRDQPSLATVEALQQLDAIDSTE